MMGMVCNGPARYPPEWLREGEGGLGAGHKTPAHISHK